jgi:hypothetical protein
VGGGQTTTISGVPPLGDGDQGADACGDLPRRLVEARLEVDRTEHDDEHVDRPMCQQTRQEIGAAVPLRALDRIVVDGGAPAQTLFDDVPAGAEPLLQHAGPAFVEAITAIGSRLGGISPRV